jgi:hypothetical protein
MVSLSITAGTEHTCRFKICDKNAQLRDVIKRTTISPYYNHAQNKTKHQAGQFNSWKCSEVSQSVLVKTAPVKIEVTVVFLSL